MNIKLCGINIKGEFFSVLATDLTTARLFGTAQVANGAWRAWDAFDISIECPHGRRLLESSPLVARTGKRMP